MEILYDASCTEYARVGHPERPTRVQRTEEYLRQARPDWSWVAPAPAAEDALRLAHAPEHLRRLRMPGDFDADTPYFEGIYDHAALAAGAALQVAQAARDGRACFSLMRPPGHHATRKRAMGFCYLSSVALAALVARAAGSKRVAIWDFDAHHGNGTEDVVRGEADILFASVHQYPGYPGTGLVSGGNLHNYPVAPGTDRREHMDVLKASWKTVLAHKPDLILVSAGFDAYRGDPITEMTLELEDFATLGRWCSKAPCPVGAILEGGYSDDLPRLIEAYLAEWNPS